MGIQKDAGEILIYIYRKYISEGSEVRGSFVMLRCGDILNETKWNAQRLERAVFYLQEKRLISIIYGMGAKTEDIFIEKIYPEGIDIVENIEKFKTTFGFEINLGLVKFSWTKER